MSTTLDLPRETIFSPCRQYRYVLWRSWDMFCPRFAMFVGLNPSTADEVTDDPTIRRCIGFAKAWGYGALCMTNLFAYRATDPHQLFAVEEPVGPDNDVWLAKIAREAMVVIVAWGVHGHYQGRATHVSAMLSDDSAVMPLLCLGYTKGQSPRHPLYVPKNQKPVLWEA